MDWIKIFKTKEEALGTLKEGKPRPLIWKGKKFCLVKKGESIHATEHNCPHQGEGLGNGNTNAYGEIICPLHQYRFDLKTGQESSGRCRDLEIYPVKIESEGVYLGI